MPISRNFFARLPRRRVHVRTKHWRERARGHRQGEHQARDRDRVVAGEPHARAATEPGSAQVPGLKPAGGAARLRVGHRVRHQSADREHDEGRRGPGDEHDRHQQAGRVLTERHQAHEEQWWLRRRRRPAGTSAAARGVRSATGPQREAPDVGRDRDRDDRRRQSDGEPRLRQDERQRDAREPAADAVRQDEEEDRER